MVFEKLCIIVCKDVDRGGGNCKSIFGLIDNILTDHFMKNGNTVKDILTNNTDGV